MSTHTDYFVVTLDHAEADHAHDNPAPVWLVENRAEMPGDTLIDQMVAIHDPKVAEMVTRLVAENARLRAEIADLQPPF